MDSPNKQLVAPGRPSSQKTWRLGSPGVEAVMRTNCAFYDKVRTILTRRCKVPDCGYVISSIEECFSLPEIGDVCALCYHMYQALSNPGLKNPFYFKQHHAAWVKENSPEAIRALRKKLGLEGGE